MVVVASIVAKNKNPAIRGMTWRYIFALGVVAVLSCMAFISLRAVITTQESSAATINFSGKRRYMSHRAALYAVLLATATNTSERKLARNNMLEAIIMMEQAHDGLLHGNVELGLPGGASPAIAAMYFSGEQPLEPLVRGYIARVKQLAVVSDEDLSRKHPELQWITATATGPLLERLDAVVAAYQYESERDIARLQFLETMVLGLTLGVLAMEAVFIFRPMVKRVHHERLQLQQSEASTRAILDNSYDAIVVLNKHGRVYTCNKAAETMANYSLEQMKDEPFSVFDLDPNCPRDWRALPAGICSVRRNSDQAVIDVAFTTTCIADDNVIIATMRESTEQLQRYARELESRNQELDQFAYVASHDLKAPLRAMVNLAQWIYEDSGSDLKPEVAEYIMMLRARARRLEALIDGLHSYATAARPHGAPETIETGQLALEIIEEHQHGSPTYDQRKFIFSVDPSMPSIMADRVRLWQVFSNLIANAMKHHDKQRGNIKISARVIDENCEFSITDDGPGIDPSCHQRIFTIFQTLAAKDIKESLGLGLALVKKIIRETGGNIVVESQLGHGATFRFTWPCRPTPPIQGVYHA